MHEESDGSEQKNNMLHEMIYKPRAETKNNSP